MTWRVMIVEDEWDGRQWLEELVQREPSWQWVGSFATVEEVFPAFETLKPHLLLLDISLNQASIFDILLDWPLERRPKIIFITASHDHAIQAFEENAADYILKPFGQERFQRALKKVEAALSIDPATNPNVKRDPKPAYIQHLNIQEDGHTVWIPVQQIDWIEGADYYTKVHVGNQSYWSRHSLKTLESRLDPGRFLRTHKSAIIKLDRVEAYIEPALGSFQVVMKNGQRVKVSRRRKKDIIARLNRGQL